MLYNCRTYRMFFIVIGLWFSLFGSQVYAKEIVSFQVISESGSVQTNIPFTIGHTFKEGEVSEGSDIIARLSNGSVLPLQIDRKATHNDGSLRHAILSSHIPSLDGNSIETVMLSVGNNMPDASFISLDELLGSGFAADITLISSGKTYHISVTDLLRTGNPKQWLKGSEVSEWIIGGPIKDSSGGLHPHLAVYFHVRAYKGIEKVRVDVVVENGWTFEKNPGDFVYDVGIRIGDEIVYSKKDLRHYDHARWHKQFWWGGRPEVYIKHDTIYIQDTKAIPNYADLTPTEDYLDSLRSQTEPMDNGDHTDYMPQTGAQDGIGPLPRWDAVYAISGDPRAYKAMLANSDGAGAYSIHYRDKQTGLPISIHDHPDEYYVLSSNIPKSNGRNPHSHDKAHQPSMAFLAYLVTGDYYYLEELQFWATWNFLDTNDTNRQGRKGIFSDKGLQVRGRAWSLRTLGQAAYITPDNDALKSLFVENLQHNIDYNNALYVHNPKANKLWMVHDYNGLRDAKPWMDDFFTFAYGYLVDLGFERAIEMRNWKAQYVINRLGKENKKGSFCWQFAAFYKTYQGPREADKYNPANWFQSFDEYWEGNWGNKRSNGKYLRDVACDTQEMAQWMGNGAQISQMYSSAAPHIADSYYANMQPAVAVVADAGLEGSDLARYRFYEKTPVRPDYRNKPQWAVEPRVASNIVAPRIMLAASPATVKPMESSTLNWAVVNAESCSSSGGWQGERPMSGSFKVGPLVEDQLFSMTCRGNGRVTSRTVRVNVMAESPGIIEFANDAVTVNESDDSIVIVLERKDGSDGVATVEWRTKTFDGYGDADWASDYATVYPWVPVTFGHGEVRKEITITINDDDLIEDDETFTVLLRSSGITLGEITSTVVTIIDNDNGQPTSPYLTFSISPAVVDKGNSATLTWSSERVDSCEVSGGWSGPRGVDGREVVAVEYTSKYIMTCKGPGGQISKQVTAFVKPSGFDKSEGMAPQTFEEYRAGMDPVDWLDTKQANSLDEDDSLFSVFKVGNNSVFGTDRTKGINIHSHYVGEGSEFWTNYRYLGKMMITNERDSIGVTFFSDYPNSDSYYRLRRSHKTTFHIAPHGSGIRCEGDRDTGVIPRANRWYHFIAEAEDLGGRTAVRAKVWEEGESEPADWQVDCLDYGARLSEGTIGVWAVVDDAGRKYWDNLEVVSIGEPGSMQTGAADQSESGSAYDSNHDDTDSVVGENSSNGNGPLLDNSAGNKELYVQNGAGSMSVFELIVGASLLLAIYSRRRLV